MDAPAPGMSPDPLPGPPVKRKRGQCRYCPEIHPKLADLIKHEASHVQRPPEPPPLPVATPPLPQPTNKPDVIVKPPDSEQSKAQKALANGKKRPKIESIEEEDKRILEEMQQYDWTLNFVKIKNTEKGQNLFQCKDCQLVLINKSAFELRRHNIAHTGEKLYSCPICNDKFQSSWNRKRHLNSVHAQEAKITLKNKRIKVEDPEDEEKALLAKMDNYDWTGEFEKDAEGEFCCKRCDTKLSNSSRSDLAAHNMIHTGEKPFPCGIDDCPDMFRTILVRDRHRQSFHQDSQLNSPIKMVKSTPPETLPKKKEKKLGEIKKQIVNSGATMKSRANKSLSMDEDERRLFTEYDPWSKDFEKLHIGRVIARCLTCQKTLQNSSKLFLYGHNAAHSNLKPFKCHFCLKAFHFINIRIAHEAKFHSQQKATSKKGRKLQKPKEKISDLPKSSQPESLSTTSVPLEGSRVTHAANGGNCAKKIAYRKSTRLDEDEMRLISEYDWNKDFERNKDISRCRICSKSLKNYSLSYLYSHNSVHLGVKPFKCHFCPLTFHYANARFKHEGIFHTQQKTTLRKDGKTKKRKENTPELRVLRSSKGSALSPALTTPRATDVNLGRDIPVQLKNREEEEERLLAEYDLEKDFVIKGYNGGTVYSHCICSTCQKILRNTSKLNLFCHNASHSKTKHFHCGFCSTSFTYPSVRNSHEIKKHGRKSTRSKKPGKKPKSIASNVEEPQGLKLEVSEAPKGLEIESGILNNLESNSEHKPAPLKLFEEDSSASSRKTNRRNKIKKNSFKKSQAVKSRCKFKKSSNLEENEKELISAYVWEKDFEKEVFLDRRFVVRCLTCRKILRNTSRTFLFSHNAAHLGQKHFSCRFCRHSYTQPYNRLIHEFKVHKKPIKTRKSTLPITKELSSRVASGSKAKSVVSPSKKLRIIKDIKIEPSFTSEEELEIRQKEYDPTNNYDFLDENSGRERNEEDIEVASGVESAFEGMNVAPNPEITDSESFVGPQESVGKTSNELTLEKDTPIVAENETHDRSDEFICGDDKNEDEEETDFNPEELEEEGSEMPNENQEQLQETAVDDVQPRKPDMAQILKRKADEALILEEMRKFDPSSDFTRQKNGWKCNICEITLKSSEPFKLNAHLMIHTGFKPFSAFCCEKKFARMDTRDNHESRKHFQDLNRKTRQETLTKNHEPHPINGLTTSKFKPIQSIQVIEMAKSVRVGLLRIEADPDLAGVFAEALKKRGNLQEEKDENCTDQNGESSMNLIIPESVEVKSEIPMDTFQNETFVEHNDSIQVEQSEDINKPDSESDSREVEEFEKDTEPIANALESPNKIIEIGLDAVLIETQPEVIQEVSQIDLEEPKGPKFLKKKGIALKNQKIPGNFNMKMRQFVKESSGYRCLLCGRFFNMGGMVIHMQSHAVAKRQKSKGPGGFPCSYCGKVFNKKEKLKEHEDLHKGRLQYNCGICLEKFKARGAYYLHMKKHREDCKKVSENLKLPDKTPILCLIRLEKDRAIVNAYPGIFGRKNEQDPILKEEVLFNDDDLLEMDEAISDITNKSSNDERAEKIQSDWCKDHFDFIEENGKTTYRCKVCQKIITSRLKSHHRIHTGEYPYKCDCGKGFASSSNLIRHKKICKDTQESRISSG